MIKQMTIALAATAAVLALAACGGDNRDKASGGTWSAATGTSWADAAETYQRAMDGCVGRWVASPSRQFWAQCTEVTRRAFNTSTTHAVSLLGQTTKGGGRCQRVLQQIKAEINTTNSALTSEWTTEQRALIRLLRSGKPGGKPIAPTADHARALVDRGASHMDRFGAQYGRDC